MKTRKKTTIKRIEIYKFISLNKLYPNSVTMCYKQNPEWTLNIEHIMKMRKMENERMKCWSDPNRTTGDRRHKHCNIFNFPNKILVFLFVFSILSPFSININQASNWKKKSKSFYGYKKILNLCWLNFKTEL